MTFLFFSFLKILLRIQSHWKKLKLEEYRNANSDFFDNGPRICGHLNRSKRIFYNTVRLQLREFFWMIFFFWFYSFTILFHAFSIFCRLVTDCFFEFLSCAILSHLFNFFFALYYSCYYFTIFLFLIAHQNIDRLFNLVIPPLLMAYHTGCTPIVAVTFAWLSPDIQSTKRKNSDPTRIWTQITLLTCRACCQSTKVTTLDSSFCRIAKFWFFIIFCRTFSSVQQQLYILQTSYDHWFFSDVVFLRVLGLDEVFK